jgi:dTMP kinase
VHAHLWPQRTLLLDLPVELGLTRARARRAGGDRFEDEERQFFERARARYLQVAAAEPQRVRVIDARLDPALVATQAFAAIEDLL